jgi:hypothetical protein
MESSGSAPDSSPSPAGERGVARLTESPLSLLRRAAGSPRELREKLARLGAALSGYADRPLLDARLERLRVLGHVEQVPSRLQLIIGSIDMLRFWISPAAAEYYGERGIHFGFHQILRILEEPASMVDPTGFLTDRDVVIDHLLQVTHANPAYDLQLLEVHADGLAQLEAQTAAAIAGTHPKSAMLAATVEDAGYHARLLEFVKAYRADRKALPPIRSNIAGSEKWAPIERTFGTLPAAVRYFAKMPTSRRAAARHLLFVKEFPRELAEPA